MMLEELVSMEVFGGKNHVVEKGGNKIEEEEIT